MIRKQIEAISFNLIQLSAYRMRIAWQMKKYSSAGRLPSLCLPPAPSLRLLLHTQTHTLIAHLKPARGGAQEPTESAGHWEEGGESTFPFCASVSRTFHHILHGAAACRQDKIRVRSGGKTILPPFLPNSRSIGSDQFTSPFDGC